jgi:photosystem II stability/assembly factor-like uncharacterized protein
VTDDELIDRLRRTLHTEAEAITPSPAGEQAAPYPVSGPSPRVRARWPLALAAAAVAAGVALLVLNWPGGGPSHTRIGIVAPSPSTPSTATTPSSSTAPSTAPSTVATTVPSTAAPPPSPAGVTPSSAPPASVGTAPAFLPADFAPQAVTFVSASEGWVAGSAPCGTGSCLTLGHTSDAGRTWQPVSAPAVLLSGTGYGTPVLSVRFADRLDGWIYTVNPLRLWSTHDGGRSWRLATPPELTPQSSVMAMEASAGRVQLAIAPANAATIHVETSPIDTDAWTDVDTGTPVGAGPVPSTQLVLQRSRGWLLENDRTVVGGVQLGSSGRWGTWTPPCQMANGPASLAASTPDDLVAVCVEGDWGPARNLPAGASTPSTWLFKSTDGGASFHAVGPMAQTLSEQQVASPSPSVVVVTESTATTGLDASFDGGHSWQSVYRNGRLTSWFYLGFTTTTQGVAIGSGPSGHSVLLMTRDGGHHWAPVSFGSGA